MSKLILITGLSCTGKTTIGEKISKKFNFPLISRDNIKESLFDSLGYKDRKWSKKLGSASYDLLFDFIEKLLSTKYTLIVETNFNPKLHNKKLKKLKKKYNTYIIQLYCYADDKVILDRFRKRWKSGKRHPGHVDHISIKELGQGLAKKEYRLINVGDKIIKVNTNNFKKINYKNLFKEIKSKIQIN